MLNENHALVGVVIVWIGSLHPDAAAGAVCGGFFFWSLSQDLPIINRFFLLLGSVGLGYGMALPLARVDNGWAWFVAGIGASLVHVVIEALREMVNNGSPWPPWLRDLVSVLPIGRKQNQGRNDDDSR